MTTATGLAPAMLTSWGSDEEYDPNTSESYVRWLIENGVQAVVPCGSTGENIAMTNAEQKAIIEHVVKFVAGEVPVYAGTGRYSTRETLDLTTHAEAVGADGVMVILPYYLKPYSNAAMDHLRAIRQAIRIPIVLYNNPHFAGYELTTPQVKELWDERVIQAVKVAHGDVSRVSSLRQACGDELVLFYGHDIAAFQGIASGADGWLSGFPAAFPKQCRQLQDAILVRRNMDEARRLWSKFVPFLDLFLDPQVNAKVHWLEMLKWAVTVQGVAIGKPRRPLRELDSDMGRQLHKSLETLLG